MLPAFDSCEDALWVGSPYEGFGIGVCFSDEAIDSDWQINDGSEHAALEATAGEFGEEAFNRVAPGCGGWGKVERPAGILGQPLAYLRMLVGRILSTMAWITFTTGTCSSIVLRKRMNSSWRWRCMLRPMTVPSRMLRGCEQRRGAVTFVVVRHRPGAKPGLDLAFLIDQEDDRMGGRIDVEAKASRRASGRSTA